MMPTSKRSTAVRSMQRKQKALRTFEGSFLPKGKLTSGQLSAKIGRLNKLRRAAGEKGKIETVVRPGLAKEWTKFRETVNRQGEYGKLIFKGTVAMMNALAQGKTPRQAFEISDDAVGAHSNMSFMYTCQEAIRFSPRAREMAQWFKGQLLQEGTKEKDLGKYIPKEYL